MALAVINQRHYNALWWNWYFTKCWSNPWPKFAPDKKQSSVQWMSSHLNVLQKLNGLYIIYQMGFKKLRTSVLHKGNPHIHDNRVKTSFILVTLALSEQKSFRSPQWVKIKSVYKLTGMLQRIQRMQSFLKKWDIIIEIINYQRFNECKMPTCIS